jgi:hypothetical protein
MILCMQTSSGYISILRTIIDCADTPNVLFLILSTNTTNDCSIFNVISNPSSDSQADLPLVDILTMFLML